ncbi:MAG: hypothetical protein EBU90_11585 [Proteobacteria bacterium]|nr:hypothetical protein [Pseudomonadota bacterium]NBP14767.1 hypothetical protein [bacterium]
MNTFVEFLLLEGGAAGHMAHPFDLQNIKKGTDLINFFKNAAKSVENEKTVVKFDGLNASVKIIKNEKGNLEYALDRGSAKEIDLKGVTLSNLEQRFEKGHGMINVANFILPVFNSTIESTMPELKKLGLLKPNVFLNIEYITQQTNVTHYDRSMIVIHGISQFVPKIGKNKRILSRTAVEISYNKSVLNEFISKIKPAFAQHKFEVFGPTATKFDKKPNFESVLNKPFGIAFSETDTETRTLANWLKSAKNPKNIFLKDVRNKKVPAMSKAYYQYVLKGLPIDKLVGTDKLAQKAVADGAIFYQATRLLGNEMLNSLSSEAGELNKHEGIVIRDSKIASVPVKITGEFILKGLASPFKKSENDENLEKAEGVSGLIGALNYANTTGNYMQNKSYLRQPPYESPPNPGAYVG